MRIQNSTHRIKIEVGKIVLKVKLTSEKNRNPLSAVYRDIVSQPCRDIQYNLHSPSTPSAK